MALRKSPGDIPLSEIATYEAGVVQAAAFRLLKRFTDNCLKEYGITTTQWFIVGTVAATGNHGIRITDLAKRIDTTMSFLTNSVNILESKGYLSRGQNNNDNRSRPIYVPADVRRKCQMIETDLRTKMRDGLYKNIKPEDLTIYVKVLRQLSELNV